MTLLFFLPFFSFRGFVSLLFFPYTGFYLSAVFPLHWVLSICRPSPTQGFVSLPSFSYNRFCLSAVFSFMKVVFTKAVFPLHWVLSLYCLSFIFGFISMYLKFLNSFLFSNISLKQSILLINDILNTCNHIFWRQPLVFYPFANGTLNRI